MKIRLYLLKLKNQKENTKDQWQITLDKHILDNLDDNRFGVEFLASKMNMSRRNLQRKIKEATGSSPKEYVNHLRLEKAKEFIELGQFKTIKELSMAIGIKNQSYFSDLFKDKFGKTPAELMKNDN